MSQQIESTKDCFLAFKQPIVDYTLPERFPSPFLNNPHPLCLLAAAELQTHLLSQTDWKHDFDSSEKVQPTGKGIGKMFGVLVAQNQAGTIGYLAAFSGKLANGNHHPKFVPPVYDMLLKDSFLNKGMAELNALNSRVKCLEKEATFIQAKQLLEQEKQLADSQLAQQKQLLIVEKLAREVRRKQAQETLIPSAFLVVENALKKEGIAQKKVFIQLANYWKKRLLPFQKSFQEVNENIVILKKERREKSADLQQQLFESYQFLNQKGVRKNLLEIFVTAKPVSGAGECAGPKLLQYAFLHKLHPIAMAEFWWGTSPTSEIRQHGHFYPACEEKCRLILGYMLTDF